VRVCFPEREGDVLLSDPKVPAKVPITSSSDCRYVSQLLK
jgi:hypothetical protein